MKESTGVAKAPTLGVAIGTICSIVQLILDWTARGVFISGVCFLSYWIGIFVLFRRETWREHCIPSLILTGFWCYYFAFPLLAMTLMGNRLSNNLELPIKTFSYASYTFLGLIGGFLIYVKFVSDVTSGIRHAIGGLASTIGWWRVPSNFQIWIFGMVGILSSIFASEVYDGTGNEVGSGAKLFEAYIPYAFAPLILPIEVIWRPRSAWSKKNNFYVVIYFLAVIFVGLIRNSRSAVFEGIFTLLIGVVLAYSMGYFKFRQRQVTYLCVGAICLGCCYPIIKDFSLAMVVAREKRGTVSSLELVNLSYDAFMDKSALKAYSDKVAIAGGDWREEYTGSSFLDRLCNVRYLDLSLFWSEKLPTGLRQSQVDFEVEKSLAMLPKPIISLLGLSVDKDYVNSMTSGDHLLYLATGDVYARGSFRTGSIIGSAITIFGSYIYIVPLVLLSMLIWTIADALTPRRNSISEVSARRKIQLPLAFVIGLYPFLFQMTSAAKGFEGMSNLFGYLVRGGVQQVFLFCVLFWISRFIESLVLYVRTPTR